MAFCPFGFTMVLMVTGAPPAVAAQLAVSSEGQAFAVFAKSPSALAPLPLYEQLVRPPACLRLTRYQVQTGFQSTPPPCCAQPAVPRQLVPADSGTAALPVGGTGSRHSSPKSCQGSRKECQRSKTIEP